MADSGKAGLRQMMPGLFNGIATAIAAAAGLIGVLHQTGYLGTNHPRLHAGIEARPRAQMRMPDETQLAAVDSPAAASLPLGGRAKCRRRASIASRAELDRRLARQGRELSSHKAKPAMS